MILKGNESKATSSLFPSEMIAKLETTLSTAKQNRDHEINMGATINNDSTTKEPQP